MYFCQNVKNAMNVKTFVVSLLQRKSVGIQKDNL